MNISEKEAFALLEPELIAVKPTGWVDLSAATLERRCPSFEIDDVAWKCLTTDIYNGAVSAVFEERGGDFYTMQQIRSRIREAYLAGHLIRPLASLIFHQEHYWGRSEWMREIPPLRDSMAQMALEKTKSMRTDFKFARSEFGATGFRLAPFVPAQKTVMTIMQRRYSRRGLSERSQDWIREFIPA